MQRTPPRRVATDSRRAWLMVAVVTTILTFTSGARLLPGVVLKPITGQFDWTRSELMLALTINMAVLSVLQPVMGLVTDRFGAKRVLVGGTALLGLTLLPLSQATRLWHFYVLYGLIAAIALAAVSPPNVTSLVSSWFVRRRGAAFSIATSGAAFGQLMVVPAAAWLLTFTSWPSLYLLLGLAILFVMTPLGIAFLHANGGSTGERADALAQPASGRAVRLPEAIAGSSFWLLAFGFFACGFTMAFASAHFLAYADDMGMRPTRAADIVAATAICSIGGSFLLGAAADRFPRQRVLALTYALRGFAFVLLYLLPAGPLLFIYAVVLGISWTATTPITAAIAADLYGRRNIGVIFGTMFSFMNIGFGAGSFLDGFVYDSFGDYRFALLANAVVGGLAAVAVLKVGPDRPAAFPEGGPARAMESAVAD